ncbi:MAG: A/G-specific adenine glycosylase [Candidatus Magasanikbacteria bacterium]|nr:A/G-specific adenine glycosylase [Candidatus Magasanikbacteria bacterium]MCA9389368.1 A/G-specific adenine glycosylase [Candidatus Magasanikbacteria bacterium]MCA9391430.1 A/G-specific adenine glycosylase [Candidatus Magasanikbacteria bacterium]USN52545.1 MAG: A/G-specific adenine glycosylase [Candidatus Nomurabacteria bacterium]
MKWSTSLLSWYRRNGRDLPWRHTRDPYRILLSEVMLQQTQVTRVVDFYKAWLKQFPSFKALATAKTSDVLKAWAGLGYNRRALALQNIAKHITANGLPKTREEWLTLKGIGPYTADAIACFSLHERRWPIDTNLRRVGGRLWLGILYPELKDDERIRERALIELPKKGDVHEIPQAAFDLAVAICAKTPQCAICPLQKHCLSAKSFLKGDVSAPKRMTKASNETIHPGKKYPDRIYRGRILAHIRIQKRAKRLAIGNVIDQHFDSPKDQLWVDAMIDRLIKDGLLIETNKTLRLPD